MHVTGFAVDMSGKTLDRPNETGLSDLFGIRQRKPQEKPHSVDASFFRGMIDSASSTNIP
jgi:hypothetical protein